LETKIEPGLYQQHGSGDMAEELKPVLFGLQREVIIYDYESALLYREGRFVSLLKPGRYRFLWNDEVKVEKVSLRIVSEVLNGQEILTADKVAVRLSLIAKYVVKDPVLAVNTVESYSDQLYQDLQLALRSAIASRDTEQILEARNELSDELKNTVAPQAWEYGVELKRVGIRDIVLPGRVRDVFMQEVEADRAGRADLIRARHEVASARARANTAKILTENPAVMRMQEMEALVKLAGKQGNVIVLPNLADLLIRPTPMPTFTPPTAPSKTDKAED